MTRVKRLEAGHDFNKMRFGSSITFLERGVEVGGGR